MVLLKSSVLFVCFFVFIKFGHELTVLLNKSINMNSDKLNNKKTNTEEAIMEASEALFLEKGYLLATTTEIARRAGVTHAMLHYYYRTKEQIFFKVLDKNLHELFQSVRVGMSSEEVSFWENLKGGVMLLLEFLDQHRQLVGLLYDVARHSPELLERYQESTLNLLSGLAGHHKVLLDQEVRSGRCNPITFEQLFGDIVTMSFSTYMFLPLMNRVAKMDDLEVDRMLKRRYDEIITVLHYRLYGKHESSN